MRRATPRALAAALVLALVASAAGEQGHLGGAHGGGSRLPARRFGADAAGAGHAGAADAGASGGSRGRGRPVPIVLPSATDPTKLTLQKQGLDALRAVRGPVAPVVVIGPYRSGKSFLLNQLLGVPCDEGFGVGHTRQTETKGVWVWSEPTLVPSSETGTQPTSVVYVDTEGFEATGMSDAYDDRIFALSSIVASVLVYNLPETVKEGDIEKLSFALELAREFSGRTKVSQANEIEIARKGGDASLFAEDSPNAYDDDDDDLGLWDASQLRAFLPDSLLWLIQRDFLEGSTVTEMVDQALRSVANPTADAHVAELNRIRESLRALAEKRDAFGLTQPHLERTRLCELRDDQLEPGYVRQREELKAHVRKSAVAKSSLGAALGMDETSGMSQSTKETNAPNAKMTGVSLAALIERSVAALNEGDFPTAGSVVDAFNRDAMEKRVEAHVRALDAVALPAAEAALTLAHSRSKITQIAAFRSERFGRGAVTAKALASKLDALFEQRSERNAFASGKACDVLASRCEETLVKMSRMRLPSLRKFDATASRECARAFADGCVGPSKDTAQARVTRAVERERAAFSQTYNARLLNGLLLIAVGGVVTFRFLWVVPLAELASWALFLLLEVAPKFYFTTALNGEGMFESTWWSTASRVWEAAVYNPVLDMDVAGPIFFFALVAVAAWVRVRRFARWMHARCPCCVPSFCHPLLGVKNEDRPRSRFGRKTDRGRDLDV
jgi:hypothetical protein